MLRNWPFHLEIDSDNHQAPLYRQIADEIMRLIETGGLKDNTVLPGSREMAARLGVNRKTVVRAYDLLLKQGALTSNERVGMTVTAADNTVPAINETIEREKNKDN